MFKLSLLLVVVTTPQSLGAHGRVNTAIVDIIVIAVVSPFLESLIHRKLPHHLHPVSVRGFPSFRTQPLENLSHYL